MKQVQVVHLAWPLVSVGFLLAAACLAGVWYINKLETDLGRAVQRDVRRMQIAEDMQLILRQLRFHAVLDAAERSVARHDLVLKDEAAFEAALWTFRSEAHSAEDIDLADQISGDYERYRADIEPAGRVSAKG